MSDWDTEHLDFDPAPNKHVQRRGDKPRRERDYEVVIPVLPELGATEVEIRTPDQRSVACVNMRLAGAPFHEIAKELGYASPTAAKNAYISAIASTHGPEDWETMRATEVLRAEQQLRRSTAMAAADYFVDKDNPEVLIPNHDKLKWHEQVRKDLETHAMISGAKAPIRVEQTVSEVELNQLVDSLLEAQGFTPELEGEIVDVEEIPQIEGGTLDDED